MKPGEKFSLNGVIVDYIPTKGLRLRIKGQSRHYGHPTEAENVNLAARAIRDVQHIEEGTKKVERKAVERKVREIVNPPEPPGGPVPLPKGTKYIPIIVNFRRTRYPGRTPETDKTIRLRVRHATDLQRRYVPDIVNNMTVDVQTNLKGRAFANMTSQQAFIPTLYRPGEMKVHEEYAARGQLIGVKAHMNIRASTFVATNDDEIRDRQWGGLDTGDNWWTPADPQYSLADVIIAHEIGHAVHGMLNVNGIQGFGWSSSFSTAEYPEAAAFWNGLADAMGVPRPTTVEAMGSGSMSDAKTELYMNPQYWLNHNRMRIQRKVSRYGAKKNVRELTAELWAEYTLNSNPRPAAKYYGDYVMRMMAGKQIKGAA
jgi:hypothetical protein